MQRLIDLPATREPDADILRQLREIEPYADAYYAGEGVWWIGCVKPRWQVNGEGAMVRRRTALNMLATERKKLHPSFKNLRLAQLMLQGFSLIMELPCRDLDGSAVKELAYLDWCYRTNPDGLAEDQLDNSEGLWREERRRKTYMDYLQTDGKAVHRRELRHRVTAGYGGIQ